MITQDQQKAIFTNIETAYTVDTIPYTAYKIYRDHWQGVVDDPTIVLHYRTRAKLEQDSIGRMAEYDSDILTVEVCAVKNNANEQHGLLIAETIMRELVLWFKESFDTDLKDYGVTATIYRPVEDLSILEQKIYRLHAEFKIFYKLI